MVHLYKIAGLYVEMDSYGRTAEQAEKYLCSDAVQPDIVIHSYKEVMQSRYPTLSDDDAEYLGTGGSFYKSLLEYDGFQMHSSAVVVDGRAYLFTANSGTGKSTHTDLWLQVFGERAYILNDDKPALRLEDGIWYAYGTPWSGKNDISVNTRIPLAGIAILQRGESNSIEPYTDKNLVSEIFKQTNRPKAMEHRIKLLTLLDKLLTQVPVWKLKCNMDPEAALVSYTAMSAK